MTNPPKNRRSAYTLIELMVAVTLSLLLLIGVTDMFRNMGDTINETQATLNMGQNLNNVAMQLRADLSDGNLDVLARKPAALVASPQGTEASATGYLEIIEGQGAPPAVVHGSANITNTALKTFWDSLTPAEREKYSMTSLTEHTPGKHIPPYWTAYSPDSPNGDLTVGDVDDILAFTASGNFRGLIDNGTPDGAIVDATDAEIIWFLRGTNLYRRVLMIKTATEVQADGGIVPVPNDYLNKDLSVANNPSGAAPAENLNSLADLDRRGHRFAHHQTGSSFPFPLHTGTYQDWYYLRMPTLEETISTTSAWTPGLLPSQAAGSLGVTPGMPFWDFWENPNGCLTGLDSKTGSLSTYVETPRNPRAGEDIIMSNVIGFDVKVWNPYWVPCGVHSGTGDPIAAPPQHIDLGQDRFWIVDAKGNGAWYNVDYRFNSANPVYTTSLNAAGDLVSVPIPADKVGYGFTLKGRYNKTPAVKRDDQNATKDDAHKADRIRKKDGTAAEDYANNTLFPNGIAMTCVFDSWSEDYVNIVDTDGDNVHDITGLATNLFADPPYTEPLRGLQITIRCFEPQSGAIKQIRVVRSFQ